MKSIAKFLTGLTLAVLLFALYYALSSRLQTNVTVSVEPASQNAQAFADASARVASGAFEGISALDTADAYSFVTIRVSCRNYSLFTAEWAQFAPKALDGDALTITSDAGPKDIDSFGTGEFSVTLLTKSPDVARGGWLEYYIFGRFHSIQAQYAPAA